MLKRFTFVLCTYILLLVSGQLVWAQETASRKSSAVSSANTDREQDGLNGPVRRVRVDSATIIIKDGKPVEGPRVLREITTYDMTGRRVDTVAHPVEGSTLPGKEEYKYDNKGNIIEMLLRANDGSILSKEIYTYEFDQFRNWKKMTTSVGTYEDGKLGFEPIEINYRTITYYYAQAIDQVARALPQSARPVPAASAPSFAEPKASGMALAKDTVVSGPVKDRAAPGPVANTAVPGSAKDTVVSGPVKDRVAPGPVANTAAPGSAKDTVAPGPVKETVVPGPVANTAVPGSAKDVAPGPVKETVVPGPVANTAVPGSAKDVAPGPVKETVVPGPVANTAVPGSAKDTVAPGPVKDAVVPGPITNTVVPGSEKTAENEGNSLQIGADAKDIGSKDTTASSDPQPNEDRKAANTVTGSATTAPAAATAPPVISPDTGSATSEKLPVKQVSEEILRAAAVSLPQPEYPPAAKLAGLQGRVEVEVIVDEKGEVTSARATSGHALLTNAAEGAARAARFTPAQLSQDPARVFGLISYDFVLPTLKVPTVTPATAGTEDAKKTKALKEPAVDSTANTSPQSSASSSGSGAPSAASSGNPTSFYKQGLSYLRSGRHAEAAEAFKQAVHLNPEDAGAYAKLGLCYSGLGQFKEAVAVFKMAINIQPQVVDSEGYYQLGQAYTSIGKHSEALDAFKQALYLARAQAIDPDQSKGQSQTPTPLELHYGLALAYHNTGHYNDAVKELKLVIDLNPKLAEAYYGLALAYLGVGDRISAEKQQKILSSLNPALAEKLSGALSTSRILPPGVNRGRP